jgi:hypothetical protein
MNQGTRWALLMQKNHHQKSHAWAPLRYSFLHHIPQYLVKYAQRIRKITDTQKNVITAMVGEVAVTLY